MLSNRYGFVRWGFFSVMVVGENFAVVDVDRVRWGPRWSKWIMGFWGNEDFGFLGVVGGWGFGM